MEFEKKIGSGLPDPEAIAKFKSHELAAVSLVTYMQWLNEWGAKTGADYEFTFDSFFEWGETEVVVDEAISKDDRRVLVYWAGNGDDGGPALITVQIERFFHSDAYEVRSIVQEFDTMTSLVWANGLFQFGENDAS